MPRPLGRHLPVAHQVSQEASREQVRLLDQHRGQGLDEFRRREIDNLLVRIHLIIEIVLVDRPCAMGV